MEQHALSPALVRLALAISVVGLPTAASAQVMVPAALSNLSLSKSEAILGGSSALAQLLAKQGGVRLDEQKPLQPAALPDLSRLRPTQAVIRSEPTKISPAVASGRPDVFGSVALTVSRTPLDYRWAKVENAKIGGKHAAYALSLRDRDEGERIDAINAYVNRHVRFVDDARRFGRADVWLSASETLSSGRGDCEDYAIAKLQMLRAAGLADRDLYLVVLKDLVRRSDHAVLVVRSGGRMLMLDNGTDTVLDSEAVKDYRPVLTFTANGGSWTHGYRRSLPPVTYASANFGPVVPAARP